VNSLEITTMVGCPLLCTICPQDKIKGQYQGTKYLTLENFKKVLSKLPQDVSIIFAGFSEPWVNSGATDMLEEALLDNRKVEIYTTLTYTSLSDAKRIKELITQYRRQVIQMWVHLPDASGNMPGFKFSDEYNSVIDIFREVAHFMTMDTNSSPHPDINAIKTNKWTYHTRADNISLDTNLKIQTIENEFVIECLKSKTLTANVLLPNGDVSLCCMDYGLKHIIGNLFNQTYDEIVNSDTLTDIKTCNSKIGFNEKTLCRTCVETTQYTPWNNKDVHAMMIEIDTDFTL